MTDKTSNTESLDEATLKKVYQDITQGDVFLPVLPELALTMRKALNNPSVTITKLADEIKKDPAIAGRLVQVANSAYYARAVSVDTLAGAVSRLGLNKTYNLAMAITAANLFETKSQHIKEKMQQANNQSIHLSALSCAIASELSGFDSDKALLHGLFAVIGEIPVLVYSNENPELFPTNEVLDMAVSNLRANVGEWVLSTWNFDQSFLDTAKNIDSLDRPVETIDYPEIVSAAALITESIYDDSIVLDDMPIIQCFKENDIDLTGNQFIQLVSDEVAELELVLSGRV